MPTDCACNPMTYQVCGRCLDTEGLIRLCEAIFQGAPSKRPRKLARATGGRPDDCRADFIARKLG